MSEEERQSSDGSESTSDESTQSEPELMIATRERRKTAGNRYSQVVAEEQAEEEDDVALLFAEAEGEDEEYNSDEADDEADMSSSDDDDQGPNAAVDDMEGEKDLEKQAKAERQRKRKADMAMTTMSAIRKKPKIDPTALHRAPDRPKPSKRKDRESWLPIETSTSGRTSLRQQTVQHREELLERLKENEEMRLKNKAQREEKEKKKQADAPRVLTQADRLAEAAKVERRNAKSLNRWETMEKQRAEEQAAKLAALKDRKLNGAVVTFHSSKHIYRGPKVEALSADANSTEDRVYKKRGPKPKNLLQQLATTGIPPVAGFVHTPYSSIVPSSATSQVGSTPTTPIPPTPFAAQANPALNTVSSTKDAAAPTTSNEGQKAGNESWLAGIHEFAMQPGSGVATPSDTRSAADSSEHIEHRSVESHALPQPQSRPDSTAADEKAAEGVTDSPTTESTTLDAVPAASLPLARTDAGIAGAEPQNDSVLARQSHEAQIPGAAVPPTIIDHSQAPATATIVTAQPLTQAPIPPAPPVLQSQPQAAPAPGFPNSTPIIAQIAIPLQAHHPLSTVLQPQPQPQHPLSIQPQPQPQPQPLIETTSTRNLLILQNFEALTADAKAAFAVLQNTKKSAKPTKQAGELCAITGLPAKYRDPNTGVAYANKAAFKKLKEIRSHGYRWSSMLGCYVGKVGHVARGVPDGFLGL